MSTGAAGTTLCQPQRKLKKDLTFKKFFDIIYIESEKRKTLSQKVLSFNTLVFNGTCPPPR